MTDHQDLLTFAASLADILGQGKHRQIGLGKWITCCPAHEDDTPSLGIYVDEQIRLHCWAGCTEDAIRSACRDRGVPEFPQQSRSRSGGGILVNKIAHEDTPSDDWYMSRFERLPDHVYHYRNADGQTVFVVVRMDATKQAKKEIRAICSARPKDQGKPFWIVQAFPANVMLRPLYGLTDLVSHPDVPVLLVEGEKAAEAARILLPNHVVLTWAGGTSTIKQTQWASLARRDVTLWPDNDEPGIKAMKEISLIIGRGKHAAKSVRLAFDEVLDEFPNKFDLGDPYEEYYTPLYYMLDEAGLVDLSKLPDKPVAADEEELAEHLQRLLDTYVAVLIGKDVLYVNVKNYSPRLSRTIPYLYYSLFSLGQKEVDSFLDIASKVPKKKKYLDVYLESNKKVWADGLVYDPSSMERMVGGRLNLYCGMAWPPKECDQKQYQCFIDHIHNSCQNPEEAEYLLDWFAFKFQYPDVMAGTMVILSGRQGCGKTIVCDILKEILGAHNAAKVPMSTLAWPFNSHYANKLMLDIEEYNPGSSKFQKDLREKVKDLVTSPSLLVNTKNLPAFENPCYHSIIATTNAPNSEEIGFDNRRMTFFRFDNRKLKTQGAVIRDEAYFRPLVELAKDPTGLSGLCHYLSNRKIDISKVMKPFETEMTKEAKTPVDMPEWEFLKVLAETGTLPNYSDELPSNTNNPYPLNRWPEQAAAMPRSVLTQMYRDWCKEDRHEKVKTIKAGRALMKALPRVPRGISPEFDIDKNKRWEMVDGQGTTSELINRSICLPGIDELREIVERVLGEGIEWSEMTREAKPDDKVVDFPGKKPEQF